VGADEDLARAATRGDRDAFAALMTRHQLPIHRLVSRYVRADAAADVVQETFVAAWRNLARFDPSQRFDVWLRTIAVNKSRDHLRRGAVRRFINIDFGEAPADVVDVSATNPETSIAERQEIERLDRAIRSLPTSLKDALVLTALEGLSHSEAGAVLGVSAKSIETRLYRARQKLAGVMNLPPD
jgi:RNA polymerase sigma factor CnrH